ncbi:indolepyruvate ferredoxin oxidoreductase [Prosthecochloris sp. GSB1]|uniref:thiamine pyrophosphate-dependent enzyme n=1 Tax=Prosthecochloris sp. GSB1 TaxID=281093 RepID=UPI000B8C9061|nr:thiamine pyrophosphate-dependent enzyme [Prosthecochloris sp. GSB1]ASQ90292.1 indolepyruvate ferredoxin oxidoreductase [Prosthecochloris sp. GSB1]
MRNHLLLGAEAIGAAALDAGISGVYAYPGTPSTEITEFIQRSPETVHNAVRSSWSANEKTALEAALGMSFAGKRSLCCMKHVGLNVAADAFINAAITGVNGGLVIAVADDPSMHSSQNEQDSRIYGKFAMIPVLEPATQQELYDTTVEAFALSEELRLPVLLRLTTRLSHSRCGIRRLSARKQNELQPESDPKRFVLIPSNARRQYDKLLDLQPELAARSESSHLNRLIEGAEKSGIVAFGVAFNYVMEVIQAHGLSKPVLRIGQYPLPEKMLRRFIETCETVLVAEDGYPVAEEYIRGLAGNPKVHGRLDGALPRSGELNADLIAEALGIRREKAPEVLSIVADRPPELCKGCGHRDMFEAISAVMNNQANHQVFSDIGCYTLGALPPFNAIHSCVDMGAAVTMAKGAADAGMTPAVAVIGDSTFTHSGITGLLDAVNDRNAVTVIIADNTTTAMTGGQASAATGRLQHICEGIGVEKEHIRTLVPLKKNLEHNITVLREEIAHEGVSVVIFLRECVEIAQRRLRSAKQQKRNPVKTAS